MWRRRRARRIPFRPMVHKHKLGLGGGPVRPGDLNGVLGAAMGDPAQGHVGLDRLRTGVGSPHWRL